MISLSVAHVRVSLQLFSFSSLDIILGIKMRKSHRSLHLHFTILRGFSQPDKDSRLLSFNKYPPYPHSARGPRAPQVGLLPLFFPSLRDMVDRREASIQLALRFSQIWPGLMFQPFVLTIHYRKKPSVRQCHPSFQTHSNQSLGCK